MNHVRQILVLGLVALTAACGKKAETPAATGTNQTAPAAAMDDGMGNMAMTPAAAGVVKAKGHGTVKAVDKAAGTITIDHGPIAEAKWPAMTMTFKAPASVTEAAQVGDVIDFDISLSGDTGEVTAIHK